MKLSEEKLTRLINKMINVIKPKGVTDINFHLTPLGIRDDEYYMDIKYIIEDESISKLYTGLEFKEKYKGFVFYSQKIMNWYDVRISSNDKTISSSKPLVKLFMKLVGTLPENN